MDAFYTDADRAFREEVRAFLVGNLPGKLADKVRLGRRLSREDIESWQAVLNLQGWLAPGWPKEFGGPGWTAMQRHIFAEEMARASAPPPLAFGLAMLGPVLQRYGSKAQQDHYLPRILNGEDWWCQGYSEPGAGSDLASLKTSARRDGDHYVVNGQKTWTTLGQHANRMFCLVRTCAEGRPQEGISFLLLDMQAPGVTVRPIVLLDGEAEVNEVFLDNVRVPVANLVGEENKGWTYAKYLLTHERTNIAGVGQTKAALDMLRHVAGQQRQSGRPLLDDPIFAARLAEVEIALMAMETTNLRLISQVAAGQAPGVESSMLKLKGTAIRQEIHALTLAALGLDALPFAPEMLEDAAPVGAEGSDYAPGMIGRYFNGRKLSIYGGSSEVQRGIIAKSELGR